MKKIIMFFMTLFFVGTSMVFAKEIAYAFSSSTQEERLINVLDFHLDSIKKAEHVEAERDKIKELHDWANNFYYLVECVPKGYMIYSANSGTIIEYSLKSPSPYIDVSEELYYFGPSNFYYLNNGNLTHTVTKNIINSHNLLETSILLNESLLVNKSQVTIDFINKNILPNTTRTLSVNLYGHSWTAVNNADFFRNKKSKNQMGFISGGDCGFIAAGMLIGYIDTFVQECMPDNFMTGIGVNRHFTDSSFTELLANICNDHTIYNPNNGTTSTEIKATVKAYMNEYNYKPKSFDYLTPLFSGTTLKLLIDDDVPSILFGNLGASTSPSGDSLSGGNHAVIIYGYKKGGYSSVYSFLAHYGWAGYSESTINYNSYSVFGSAYRLKKG